MSSCSIVCRRSDVRKLVQLLGVRQLAVDQQIAGLDEVATLGDHLDRVAAVAQNALFAVEKRDGAGRRAGVDVPLVERDVAGLAAQLGDVEAPFIFRCRRRPANRFAHPRHAVWPPRSSRPSFPKIVIRRALSLAGCAAGIQLSALRQPRWLKPRAGARRCRDFARYAGGLLRIERGRSRGQR